MSMGARASPHSVSSATPVVIPTLSDSFDPYDKAILGASPLESDNSTHAFKLSAGIRREAAWKKIVERAVQQCSQSEILHWPTKHNVETLVALSNALLCRCSSSLREATD